MVTPRTSIDQLTSLWESSLSNTRIWLSFGVLYVCGFGYYILKFDAIWIALFGGFLAIPVAMMLFAFLAVGALLSSEFSLWLCAHLFKRNPGSRLHRACALWLSWFFVVPAMLLTGLGNVPGYTD